MKTIFVIAAIIAIGCAHTATATKFPAPKDRTVTSPNGTYALDINTKTGQNDIREGEKVLWSFNRTVWLDVVYLSNDGQRVLWVAWEHVTVDDTHRKDALVVYSPEGVVLKKTFAEVSTPKKSKGSGPVGDFWRVWRSTTITQNDDVISIPVKGKWRNLKIDLSSINAPEKLEHL